MFPRERDNTAIQLQWKMGCFLFGPPRDYVARISGRLSAVQLSEVKELVGE
jgi:hypothetical protein